MAVLGPTTDHMEIRHWADAHGAVPAEVLPTHVDGDPALIRMMIAAQITNYPYVRQISWEEFFVKFDSLGLTFVYDDGATGKNEILQIEEKSPYRNPKDRLGDLGN